MIIELINEKFKSEGKVPIIYDETDDIPKKIKDGISEAIKKTGSSFTSGEPCTNLSFRIALSRIVYSILDNVFMKDFFTKISDYEYSVIIPLDIYSTKIRELKRILDLKRINFDIYPIRAFWIDKLYSKDVIEALMDEFPNYAISESYNVFTPSWIVEVANKGFIYTLEKESFCPNKGKYTFIEYDEAMKSHNKTPFHFMDMPEILKYLSNEDALTFIATCTIKGAKNYQYSSFTKKYTSK